MAAGDLLYNTAQPAHPARVLLPPDDAAAEALCRYLGRQVFYVHEGSPAVDELSRMRSFCLESVSTSWPAADQPMRYPSATILGGDDVQHTGDSPAPIEDTFDPFDETVAWYLGEASGTLQVDFWCDSEATRQAISAQLAALFSPGEGRGGILLELGPRYLGLGGRFSLLTHGRQDTPDAVWAGERRLRATVRWEVADVVVRRAKPLTVQARVETI